MRTVIVEIGRQYAVTFDDDGQASEVRCCTHGEHTRGRLTWMRDRPKSATAKTVIAAATSNPSPEGDTQ